MPKETPQTLIAETEVDWWGPGASTLADPLVKIKLARQEREVEFLVDTGASFSVLNPELIAISKDFVNAIGATGQQERAFFLKPLKFKLGKRIGIHRFLYLPKSTKPLLGRDLLEQLEAEIAFKQGTMELKADGNQITEILSLALMHPEKSAVSVPKIEEIISQVYPGVWAAGTPGRAKNAIPIAVELKEGISPARQKQYPLKLEHRKGIEGPINNFVQHGLLIGCESEYNTPILLVKSRMDLIG